MESDEQMAPRKRAAKKNAAGKQVAAKKRGPPEG